MYLNHASQSFHSSFPTFKIKRDDLMDYSFLEDTEKEFTETVEKLGLPDFIKILPRELLGRPYHNSHHLYKVALNALNISKVEGLSEEFQKVVFVAAVCHDLDYVSKDNEPANISLAVNKFKQVADLLHYSKEEIDFGVRSIRNTDTSVAKQYCGDSDVWILHDADLTIWCALKSFDEAWYICEGIESELGLRTDIYSTLEFLNNSKIFTLAGKELVENLEDRLKNYPTVGRWISYS